jgi:hypothetical protein
MRIKKKDILGTIHDLPIQLANIAELDSVNPDTTKSKNSYKKLLEKYKLFSSKASEKQKKEIISNLKLMNFNEDEIAQQQKILKSINSYNRLIDKKRTELEIEVRNGKNVKNNMLALKLVNKVLIDVPRNIRNDLRIYDKEIKLTKFSTKATKNRINYYSGLNYNFLIKDGFSKPYYVSYEKIQKIRREGNIVSFLLDNFKKSVMVYYERDKNLYSKSEPKKWLAKKKVYDKILNEVLQHNLEIATNKKYNKPFVKRDSAGKISKEDSEIPILMEITDELIDLYIP